MKRDYALEKKHAEKKKNRTVEDGELSGCLSGVKCWAGEGEEAEGGIVHHFPLHTLRGVPQAAATMALHPTHQSIIHCVIITVSSSIYRARYLIHNDYIIIICREGCTGN